MVLVQDREIKDCYAVWFCIYVGEITLADVKSVALSETGKDSDRRFVVSLKEAARVYDFKVESPEVRTHLLLSHMPIAP